MFFSILRKRKTLVPIFLTKLKGIFSSFVVVSAVDAESWHRCYATIDLLSIRNKENLIIICHSSMGYSMKG